MFFRRIPSLLYRLFPAYEWQVAEGCIALTFDDGPHPGSTPQLLALLRQAQIPATHFLSGQMATQYPELLRELTAAGQRIGHHGFTHLNGWKTSDNIYLQDILNGAKVIESPLFRPPYGKITPAQWKHLKKVKPGWRCIQFSLMPGDFDEQVYSDSLLDELMNARSGDIVVLHDKPGCLEKYAPVLLHWIANMQSKGLRFVDL